MVHQLQTQLFSVNRRNIVDLFLQSPSVSAPDDEELQLLPKIKRSQIVLEGGFIGWENLETCFKN